MISWYFKKVVKLAWYIHDHIRTPGTHDEYDFMVFLVNVLGLSFYNLPKYQLYKFEGREGCKKFKGFLSYQFDKGKRITRSGKSINKWPMVATQCSIREKLTTVIWIMELTQIFLQRCLLRPWGFGHVLPRRRVALNFGTRIAGPA